MFRRFVKNLVNAAPIRVPGLVSRALFTNSAAALTSYSRMGNAFTPGRTSTATSHLNPTTFTGLYSQQTAAAYVPAMINPIFARLAAEHAAAPTSNVIEVAPSRFMANGRTNTLTQTLTEQGLPADVARGLASDLAKDPTSYDAQNELYNALHREGKSLEEAAETTQKLVVEQHAAAKNEAHQDKVLQLRQQPGQSLSASPKMGSRAKDEPTQSPDPIPTTSMTPRPGC